MRSTFLPRLAIKVANYMKKIRDKMLLSYEEFFAISLYLLVWSAIAGTLLGSLIFVVLTR